MDLDTELLKRGVALSEQVYQVVRGLIVSGRMRPGEAVIEAAWLRSSVCHVRPCARP